MTWMRGVSSDGHTTNIFPTLLGLFEINSEPYNSQVELIEHNTAEAASN